MTSTISFHEVLTAYTAEEFKLSRRGGALVTSGVSIVLSAVTFLALFGVDFLTLFDYLTANILMPLGAMFTCIFVMWFMKNGFMKNELTNNGTCNPVVSAVVMFMLRYVTPVLIFYIFLTNLL